MKLYLALCAALAACGGGGGSSDAVVNSAQADQLSQVFYPAQPTEQRGQLWFSRKELTNALQLTGSSGYIWQSVYTVTVRDVKPTDIVHCIAQAEVTNNLGYNVQVDRAIAIGDWSGTAWPTFVNPVAGQNVTPGTHHMYVQFSTYDEHPRAGDITYSLVLQAASTAAGPGALLAVEPGYGMLQCKVNKGE